MTNIFFDLYRDRAARVGVIGSLTSSFIAIVKNNGFLPTTLESLLACGLTLASICYIGLKINALLREREKSMKKESRRGRRVARCSGSR